MRDKTKATNFPPMAFAVIALAGLFPGCYSLKQGSTYLGYLSKGRPLESLLQTTGDAEEDERNRLFVRKVQDIKLFAREELGLELGKNYANYVRLDRDFLAAVVSASAKDSFETHLWRYPVVGSLPYKGFFTVEEALRERERLEGKGLDVWVRRVDAFSTLGWFRDPLFSFMREYRIDRLADLIIHESLHATVFLKGQGNFNEELAELVGREGSRLYVISRFGEESEEYRAMQASDLDSLAFMEFIHGLTAELDLLYSSGADREEILVERQRIIEAAQLRLEAEYDERFASENFRGLATLPINNAYLDLFRLYNPADGFIEELFRNSGKTLPEFVAAARDMPGKYPGRERLARALGLWEDDSI